MIYEKSGFIKSVSVMNIQKHSKRKVTFDTKINLLLGSSNTGKTALFRGIYWLLENRSNIKKLQKHNTDNCSVTLETDKHIITRHRDKSENTYIVDGVKFEAVGDNIPVQVLEALPPLSVQKQHDPLFLVELGNGAQSHFLNQLLKLDTMDALQLKIEKARRQCNMELKNIDIASLEKQITTLDNTKKARELLEEYKSIDIQEKIPSERDIAQYNTSKKLLAGVDLIKELSKLEYPKVPDNIERYCNLKEQIEKYKIKIQEIKPKVCPTCGRPM